MRNARMSAPTTSNAESFSDESVAWMNLGARGWTRRDLLFQDLQQPLRQNHGRGRVLPGDQVSVLNHVRLPFLGAAEVDADLFLDVGLQQPRRPRSQPDGLLLLVGE